MFLILESPFVVSSMASLHTLRASSNLSFEQSGGLYCSITIVSSVFTLKMSVSTQALLLLTTSSGERSLRTQAAQPPCDREESRSARRKMKFGMETSASRISSVSHDSVIRIIVGLLIRARSRR